jgi:hypothetical protein
MDDMTIPEAADLVRGLARQRVREAGAFAKLDGVLALATTLESALARLTKSRNELVDEVLSLTTTKSGLESALSELNALFLLTTEDINAKGTARVAEIEAWIADEEKALAEIRARVGEEAEAGERAKRALVADRETLLDRIETKHRTSLAEIRRQTDEAEGNLRATQERFARLLKDAAQTAGVSH